MLNHVDDNRIPDVYSRIEDAENVIKKPRGMSEKTYKHIIKDICYNTPGRGCTPEDYTFTGWTSFGREHDHKNISTRLEKCIFNMKFLIDAICNIVRMKRTYYKWIQITCRPPKYYNNNDIGGTLYRLDTRSINSISDDILVFVE